MNLPIFIKNRQNSPFWSILVLWRLTPPRGGSPHYYGMLDKKGSHLVHTARLHPRVVVRTAAFFACAMMFSRILNSMIMRYFKAALGNMFTTRVVGRYKFNCDRKEKVY